MKVEYNHAPLLRINWPEVYEDPEFVEWLNNPENIHATWHRGEEPNEYSDLFFTWDSVEGSDSDMPERYWDKICEIAEEQYGPSGYCLVWLTNLDLQE